MKQILVLLSFCLSTQLLLAQDKIETDRPGESDAPAIVPQHYLQAELGFLKENSGDNFDLHYPDALLRYGLLKKLELRIQGDWMTAYQQLIPNSKTTSGLKPLALGGKLSLLDEKGVLPQTSLIAHVGLPFLGSAVFRTPHLSSWIRLAMQNSLGAKADLNYNIGTEWDGESGTPAWMYAIEPGLELSEKWLAFIEVYGSMRKGEQPQHNMDAGIAYAVTNNTQLDLSAGIGLSKTSPDNFISLGFSFRIPTARPGLLK